jgi:hypothetical protein
MEILIKKPEKIEVPAATLREATNSVMGKFQFF